MVPFDVPGWLAMDAEAISRLVRKLYEAFVAGDRSTQEAILADDFTFTSPYDDRIDRSQYFTRCWPNHTRINAIRIEGIAVYDTEAFVLYTCEPKAGGRFRNVEHLVFEGSKLKAVEVYFGDPPAGVSREDYARFLGAAHQAWKAAGGDGA
jgi:hypothetical protein